MVDKYWLAENTGRQSKLLVLIIHTSAAIQT